MDRSIRNCFLNPLDSYTPIPFWFWNNALEENEIKRQIHDFKDKGVMGFVIHPRIGIPKEIEYLSGRFMELVKFAVEEASNLNMKVVLYDEAMYPSGSAHGMVVKNNPEYASRGLKIVNYPLRNCREITIDLEEGEKIISAFTAVMTDDKKIERSSIGKVSLDDKVFNCDLCSPENMFLLVCIETFSRGTIRGIHFDEDDGDIFAPPSGDLLNPKAMEKFIELTHDRYYGCLGKYFGSTIIAMFTDEPCILGRNSKRGLQPWTEDFLSWYLALGNKEEDLPLLWYDGGEGTEEVRKAYKKAVNKKLEETYYKPISNWCREHNIALTGHPEKSDEIGFLKYFHIPGQDLVWRWVAPENNKGITGEHSTMTKCSSDAARHSGKLRNSNECFGCCGPDGRQWAFNAADMKWYFDWLFVRGVNLVYPHAFFYSIEGSKRLGERPPDVGPNNIWWPHYKKFSDYIKRMCYIMTDSYNTTSIAVLCKEDFLPWKIVKNLYENQIEFNYLEDNLLAEACTIENSEILIQKQRYKILIIEDVHMLTKSLCERINEFTSCGGKVILFNPENKEHDLTEACEIHNIDEVIEMLDNLIKRDVLMIPGSSDLRVSHVIKNKLHFYYLVNEGASEIIGDIRLSAVGSIEKWDPWKGTAEELCAKSISEDGIVVSVSLGFRESVMFCIDSEKSPKLLKGKSTHIYEEHLLENLTSWMVKLPDESKKSVVLDSWTNWEGFEDFSGSMCYGSSFHIHSLKGTNRVLVDLGEVHEICELYLNDAYAGVRLWPPYRFDITGYIKSGENTVTVKITNTLANKIEKTRIKSGLLGPVRVLKVYDCPAEFRD